MTPGGLRSRPWLILCAMVLAQAATSVVSVAPLFLIPHLHATEGMSLGFAGLLAGLPTLGGVFTLVAWGAATDRWGERRVLLIGLAATVATVVLTVLASAFVGNGALGVALFLSGAASTCANSASGRLITGWFAPQRRGLAMGIRQTSLPFGTALGALVVPALAFASGIPLALAFGGAITALAFVVCFVLVGDPVRPPRAAQQALRGGPYRGSTVLVRIHAVSMLLVIPQFALSSFGLVWFTLGFGWSTAAAGALVATAQMLGAATRIAVGVWSDRLGSRLRPLRWIAVAAVASMLLAALTGWAEWSAASAVVYVLASCVSVADNGLAFTAVAEVAGPSWAGRALGLQNTGQYLTSAAVAPAVGALIGLIGIPAAFALVAIAPVLAVPLVPSPRTEQTTIATR